MNNPNNPIFRKVAIERQASPEQLDQLMQITTPKGWLALLGLGVLLALAFVWSVFATIQDTVPGKGLLVARKDAPERLEAVLYVSLEDARKIRPGLEAKIVPASARKDEGLLLGSIASVGGLPSSQKEMLAVLGNDAYVQSLAAAGALVEVRVTLPPDPDHASGYRWSSLRGTSFPLQSGTLCSAMIVVSEQSPASLILLRQ